MNFFIEYFKLIDLLALAALAALACAALVRNGSDALCAISAQAVSQLRARIQ